MATAMQTNVNLAKGVTPFRAPKPSARRARMVVTQASKEPSEFVKKAAATFAAAALTFSAPAFATEGGIMPSRNRGEDNAARAFLDSKENKGPAVQSRSSDPNSGKFQGKTNPDPRDTRNAKLGGTAGANGRSVAFYNTSDLQVNVDAVQQAKDKIGDALSDVKQAGSKASNLADDAAGTAKSAAKDVKQQRNVSFDPSSLQKNVVFGVGETGTTSEQAGKAAESAKEAIGDPAQSAKNAASRAGQEAERVLSNPAGGPDQSRRAAAQLADANAAVPKALQGGAQKIKDAVTPSSFSGYDAASLQTNVVFGIGETGTTSEQADKAADSAKEALGDPAQSAKNAASRAGQEAERVLSNPAGGPDQSKRAAAQLADANAEVPKALQGGAQKIKDAVTPSSFSGFDAASLQHNAGLEV